MAFSTVLGIFCITLLGVTFVVGTVNDIGPCKELISKDKSDEKVDFDLTVQEGNERTYEFVLGPKTEFIESLKRMWLVSRPTNIEEVSLVTIYYQTKDGDTNVYTQETVTKISGTQSIAVAKDSNGNDVSYTLTFLKGGNGWAYYYICSKDGADTRDYRYLITQNTLEEKDVQSVLQKDGSYNFNGPLMKIGE